MAYMIGDCLISEHLCDFAKQYHEDGYYTYCRVCEASKFTSYFRLFLMERLPFLTGPKKPVGGADWECPF